ncbi:TPA: HNH endonuclease [Providencia alcalifaciens]
MRPIRRNNSPIQGNFAKYEDAKNDLVSRLGFYCSYCERRINTLLAIEHIEPKDGAFGKPHLQCVWTNFLLSCQNCNSCKGAKEVIIQNILLPDRDNTYYAYVYKDDGVIEVRSSLPNATKLKAKNTLMLVGLDKAQTRSLDENKQQVALDRISQRMQVIASAKETLLLYEETPIPNMLKMVIKQASAEGFFSIWMSVFDAHPIVKIELIRTFNGVEDSGCFDMSKASTITPSPNPDCLPFGGKI